MIRNYFRGAGILGLAEGLLQFQGLIVLPFLIRQFGAINYGAWSQVSVLVATFAPFIYLGTNSATLRFLPGIDSEKQRSYFSAWVIFLVGLATLFALPMLIFPEKLSVLIFGEAGDYAIFLPVAAIWLVDTHLSNAVILWFRVKNRAGILSLARILEGLVNLLSIVLMLILNQGVYQLLVYTMVGDALLLAVLASIIAKRDGWAKPDFSILGPMLRFGLPLVPVGIATWGLNYMDRFFIVKFSSLEEVGIYSLAYSLSYQAIPLLATPLFTMYANSSAELYNQKKHRTLQRLFERAAGLMLALTVPAAVGLWLLGEKVFQILATNEYFRGVPALLFISLGYIFLVISSFYTNSFGLIHKQYLTTVIYLVAFVSNFLLNILLVPTFSILGAAIATCISFLALLLLSIYLSIREKTLQTNFSYVFKILIAAGIMATVVHFLGITMANSTSNIVLQLLLLTGVGILVYGMSLWLLDIINKDEMKLVFSLFKK